MIRDGTFGRSADDRAGVAVWRRAEPAAKQGDVIQLVSEMLSEELVGTLSDIERAHFLAAGGNGAGGWHAEIPSTLAAIDLG